MTGIWGLRNRDSVSLPTILRIQDVIFELAAVYAKRIVKNHPFVDGNKRSGLMAAYTFLAANGFQLLAAEEQAVLQTRALAAGEIGAEAYGQWLRDSCRAK